MLSQNMQTDRFIEWPRLVINQINRQPFSTVISWGQSCPALEKIASLRTLYYKAASSNAVFFHKIMNFPTLHYSSPSFCPVHSNTK